MNDSFRKKLKWIVIAIATIVAALLIYHKISGKQAVLLDINDSGTKDSGDLVINDANIVE